MSRTPFEPTFTVQWWVVVLGAALYVALLAVPVAEGDISTVGYLAGVPVGLLVGLATREAGPTLGNTLVAVFAGLVVLGVGVFVYGSLVSYRIGWGLDSLLALNIGVRGFVILLIASPLHLLQAALFALAGEALSERARERLATA